LDAVPLTNTELAELLARQSETESGVLVRAFRRAARNALFWPESAATLVAQNRSLVELSAVGPFLEKRVQHWIENPEPSLGTVPPIRRDFFALADAKSLLSGLDLVLGAYRRLNESDEIDLADRSRCSRGKKPLRFSMRR
jgi:hypothetical protein